jgi:hypothetical protein
MLLAFTLIGWIWSIIYGIEIVKKAKGTYWWFRSFTQSKKRYEGPSSQPILLFQN